MLVLLITPIRREYVQEPFVIEPVERAVLRTEVPAAVTAVFVQEGQHVRAGERIAQLSDLNLGSKAAAAAAGLQLASSRANAAQLNYGDFALAEQERIRMTKADRIAQSELEKLEIKSPIDGVVVTHRVQDLAGSYLKEGTVVAEVANPASMRARVYVSESELHKLRRIHDASLLLNSSWAPVKGTFVRMSPSSSSIEPGLIPASEYSGLHPPAYFTVDLALSDAGPIRYGMTGTAKIFGQRRSVADIALRPLFEAVARRIW